MERIVAENHLEENVRLLGGQGPDAIRQLYRLTDIVLVPSVHSENVEEATSLSALEAMASGRPLIAGAVGGLAEMVVDGENGLLVPADAKALAAAILRLAAAPELGLRLAAAARHYVVEKHSHLRAAAAYVEVYRRTVEATEAGAALSAGADFSLLATAPLSATPAAADPLTGSQPDRLPPPRWPSISVLGFPLDVVSLEQAARWAIEKASAPALPVPAPATTAQAVSSRSALAISFNPEIVVRAQHDPAVAEVMWAADLSYPDGVGAVWAATRQGARGGTAAGETPRAVERVPGIDLAQRILQLAAAQGLSVFFLGAAEGVAAEAARAQTERLPGLRVIGTHHGYFSNEEEAGVVAAVNAAAPDILLAALGAPRQELFLYRNRERLGARVALGVGGSFDVWAGVVKRAPQWTQRTNVEWLYRLASNPRRLRRQLNLPKYAVQVVRWSPEDYGPPRRRRPSDSPPPGRNDTRPEAGQAAGRGTPSDESGAA